MIDTIIIAVHTKGNRGLYHRLGKFFTSHKSVIETAAIPYLTIGMIDYGKGKTIFSRGQISLPSSHYTIAVSFNDAKGIIEFNTSIPKYFQGHNLYQHLYSQNDVNFTSEHYTIEKQKKESYSKLLFFLNHFKKNVLKNLVLDSNIQIKRIDFCYNLIFNSVQELEHYYETLKLVRMKYLRVNSNKMHNYETAFMYVGKGYSFKVYKKGPEFKKNDSSELLKYNSIKENREKFLIEKLQEFANRTLRYEMTIRDLYMSRKYRAMWFRKDCPQWNYYRRAFLESSKLTKVQHDESLDLNENDYTLAGEFVDKKILGLKNFYLDTEGMQRKINKKHISVYRKSLGKTVDFMLAISDEDRAENKNYITSRIPLCATFSGNFYDMLLNQFWLKVNDFKLDKFDISSLKNIKLEDARAINKIDSMLKSDWTLDQLKEFNLIKRSTYYKYKKLLKSYGVFNPLLKQTVNVNWDYHAYFQNYLINGGFRIR